MLLKGLNERQIEAVTTTEGPVMVMAGAGSGKTKVLTHRIAYILNETGISPYSILAVTFTNKAANEMKKRIADLIDLDTKYMWISTFHSFCARLLRMEINNVKSVYTKNFTILDEEDSLKIIKEIMKELEYDTVYKAKEIHKSISAMKNLEVYEIKDPHLKEAVLDISYKYQEYLKDNNLLDFDDLIIETIDLLKNKLIELIKEKHDEFIAQLGIKFPSPYSIGTWHSSFDVEKCFTL